MTMLDHSTQESEAGGSQQVKSQCELHEVQGRV